MKTSRAYKYSPLWNMNIPPLDLGALGMERDFPAKQSQRNP